MKILAISSSRLLRQKLVLYGARNVSKYRRTEEQSSKPGSAASMPTHESQNALDSIADLQVPHSWFQYFYSFLIFLNLFWLVQFVSNSFVFVNIASSVLSTSAISMTFPQVGLAWVLLLAQGMRRWYESQVYQKDSRSNMWVGHFALGVIFYALTSVAIWIEGSRAFQSVFPPITIH